MKNILNYSTSEYQDKYVERFLDGINLSENTDCIEWQMAKNADGYGYLWNGNFYERVHRMSYKLFKSNISKGLNVLHSCDNRLCCNPIHLSLGTKAENNRQRAERGRNRDQSGSNNEKSKLVESQVLDIRSSNLSRKDLAVKYNVCRQSIDNIIAYKTWKHI